MNITYKTLFFFIIFGIQVSYSQNLVLNPSFEEYSRLPDSKNGMNHVNYWFLTKGSSGYFHRNGGIDTEGFSFKVPLNCSGFQEPHSGDAYADIYVTYPPTVIQGQFNQRLKKGQLYYVEVYLSLGDDSEKTTSTFWFAVSDKAFPKFVESSYYYTIEKCVENNPDNFIIEKDSWQKVSGIFKAKGGEKFIAVGTITENMPTKGVSSKRITFYIDDLSVSEYNENLFADGNSVNLQNINFETGKAVLQSNSYQELDKVLVYLLSNPDASIEIIGHTDNIGSEDKNIELSLNRAKSVADYLISKNISSSRIKCTGMGGSTPISDNKTEKGRAENRRVEVKLLEKE